MYQGGEDVHVYVCVDFLYRLLFVSLFFTCVCIKKMKNNLLAKCIYVGRQPLASVGWMKKLSSPYYLKC